MSVNFSPPSRNPRTASSLAALSTAPAVPPRAAAPVPKRPTPAPRQQATGAGERQQFAALAPHAAVFAELSAGTPAAAGRSRLLGGGRTA